MPGTTNGTSLTPEAIAFATRMFNAARSGQMDIFEQALPAGLPAIMTNDKGDSLLMLAAYHGHAELVNLLMEFGASPNALNDRGQSPLAGAIFKGEDAVVEALLRGGADPEYGSPSAFETIVVFRQAEKWQEKFESARGRGKAAPVAVAGPATGSGSGSDLAEGGS